MQIGRFTSRYSFFSGQFDEGKCGDDVMKLVGRYDTDS